MNRPISMAFHRKSLAYSPLPKQPRMRFTGNRFSRWLQSKMWDYLYNSNVEIEEVDYKVVQFSNKDIVEYLDRCHRMLEYINEYHVTSVYMGGDEFNEFLHSINQSEFDVARHQGVDFKAQVQEPSTRDRYGTHFNYRNIPVRVVPHMKGVLFV